MESVQSTDRNPKKWKLAAAGAISALVLSACTSEQGGETKSVSLIENSSWNQGGLAQTPHSLEVSPQNRSIVQQSGEVGEANPSINLYGTVLEHDGDFSINLTIDNQTGPAEIILYGKPPIVSDEFRSEQDTLRVVLGDKKLRVDLSTESDGDVIQDQQFNITSSHQPKLTIVSAENKIQFRIDDEVVGELDDPNIFSGKRIWFGINALDPKGSFAVTSLTANGENGDKIGVANTRKDIHPEPDNNGVFRLAREKRSDIRFGAAVATGPMVADSKYRELLFKNFNSFTTENAGKWQFIHPKAGDGPSSYDFSEMDAIVDMAKRSGSEVHGHTLIFGEANPQWVQELSKKPTELKNAAISHITTVMKRYRGKIKSYDIVNEPLADYDSPTGEGGLRKNIWYEALGPSYIETFLVAAHRADPDAELWINEFGMESDDQRFDDMVTLVSGLLDKGVPLSGIGFQAHIDERDTNESDSHINTQKLHARIQALEKLGLRTRFSEVDISNESEHSVPSEIITVCLGEQACKGVTFWGITDAYSSGGNKNPNGTYSPGFGLLWNNKYHSTRITKDVNSALE